MKIWIDKHGGMHYHKADCSVIQPRKNPPHFHYEEIEHRVRHKYSSVENDYSEYAGIRVNGRYYSPCPFCFGYKKR